MHPVRITIKSVGTECSQKFKVGDSWTISDGKTPAGMCRGAYDSLSAAIWVLMTGGSFPWESDPEAALIACPDPAVRVVYEVRRIKEAEAQPEPQRKSRPRRRRRHR